MLKQILKTLSNTSLFLAARSTIDSQTFPWLAKTIIESRYEASGVNQSSVLWYLRHISPSTPHPAGQAYSSPPSSPLIMRVNTGNFSIYIPVDHMPHSQDTSSEVSASDLRSRVHNGPRLRSHRKPNDRCHAVQRRLNIAYACIKGRQIMKMRRSGLRRELGASIRLCGPAYFDD